MSKRILSFVLVILTVSLINLTGCSKKPAAVVNGEEISMEEFQSQLNQRLQSHKTSGVDIKGRELREAVINELIGRKLLLQVAKERAVEISDDELNKEMESIRNSIGEKKLKDFLHDMDITEKQYRKQIRETLIIRKLISTLVPEERITEERMKDYYKNRPTPYIRPERVYVRLIQVSKKDEAKEIIKELDKGISFDELAERLKTENKAAVTDYGWVQPDLFNDEIKDALKKLKKGSHGGPYKGKEGFYILRIKDREPEKIMSFEEARDQIKRELLLQQRQATIAHLIEERKKKSDIKINIK